MLFIFFVLITNLQFLVIRKSRLQWRNVTHTHPLGQNQFIITTHFVHYKGSCTIIVQLNCTPFWSLHNLYTSINLRAMQVCYMYFHHWKICTNCTLTNLSSCVLLMKTKPGSLCFNWSFESELTKTPHSSLYNFHFTKTPDIALDFVQLQNLPCTPPPHWTLH
jgi:hypothetical protein